VLEGRHKEATAMLMPLIEAGSAMAGRLAGYAVVQSRAPYARAKPYFDAAREAAQSSPYELAVTLRAVAETSGEHDEEAEAMLRELGIVSTPKRAAAVTARQSGRGCGAVGSRRSLAAISSARLSSIA
jgi:hypothetical protein